MVTENMCRSNGKGGREGITSFQILSGELTAKNTDMYETNYLSTYYSIVLTKFVSWQG